MYLDLLIKFFILLFLIGRFLINLIIVSPMSCIVNDVGAPALAHTYKDLRNTILDNFLIIGIKKYLNTIFLTNKT